MEPHSDVSPDSRGAVAERSSVGKSLTWLVVLVGAVAALLHIFSAWSPSWANWGTHHLAFFPGWLRIAVPLLMLALILPFVQERLSSAVERFAAGVRPGLLLSTLGLVTLVGLFWLAREQTYFLGDGYLDLRRVRDLDAIKNLHFRFENEPLAGLIVWHLYRLLTGWGVPGADVLSFQFLSIGAGIVAVSAMIMLVRALASGAMERILMFVVLLASGGTQLFFGYVENYPLAYALLLLYGASAVWYLRGTVPFILPALLFALLLATQFGMTALGPSLLYLAWIDLKKRRYAVTAASLLASGTLFALLLIVCGYTWEVLAGIGSRGGRHLLGFFVPASERQPYALLSVEHFMELGNLHFLLNPFALVVFLRLITLRMKEPATAGRIWRFWMVAASFALGASLVLHWDLGMSRDWDILAVFSLPLIPAALAGLGGAVSDGRLRSQVLVVIGASMLLHTVPWIGVNADTERSISRIHMLPERSVWGTTAWKAFLEELAIHFRDNDRPADAVACYEQYLAIDSMNPRIWANYAYVCSETGEDDKALAANERAVLYGSTWYGVYANLGSLYARRDRMDEAIAMLRKSLALNAAQPVILDALGNLLMSHRRSYEEAMGCFTASLAIDPASASANLNAGLCAAELRDTAGARRYYEKFLAVAPGHPRAGEVLERLRALR